MKYRTIQNDRWDQISMKFYGHPDYYKEIIKVNPHLPEEVKRSPLLPAGLELEIPEIKIRPTYPDGVPPWKG